MSILKTNQITDLGGNELLTSNGSGTISSGGLMTNTPAFIAHKTSGQSLSSGTHTKITFDAEEIDTANGYSTSTSTYTVQVAGYYNLFYSYRFDSATDFDNTLVYIK